MAARVTAFVVIAIVAVTFVAGLIVGAQREDDSGPVDLIVYNARVYTGNPDAQFAEAIAIRGNRIMARRLQPRNQAPDAPGHDGHRRARRHGHGRLPRRQRRPQGGRPDARSRRSASRRRLRQLRLQEARPTLDSCDGCGDPAAPAAASSPPRHPVARCGLRFSARLAGGGARSAAQRPLRRRLRTDAAHGAETGDTLDAIQQAIGHANTVGVTSVGVTARTPDDLLPYDTLLRTRELTARVNAALAAEWPLDEAAVARLDALRKRYEGVPLFKLKAVRLMVTDAEPMSATGKKKSSKSVKTAGARPRQARRPRWPNAQRRSGWRPSAAPSRCSNSTTGRSSSKRRTPATPASRWTPSKRRAGLAAAGAAAAGAATTGATTTAPATAGATSTAATARRHVRLEVGAGTLLDKDTVARLTGST